MKEEENTHGVQSEEGNAEQSEQKPNNVEALERKNRELLGKLRQTKDGFSELQSRFEVLEQEKLESQGKYSDINQILKQKVSDYEKQINDTKAKYAYNAVTGVVKQKALELGAVNADKVLRFMEREDMESIMVNDDFSVDESSVTSVLEKIKKDNEDIGLFKRDPIRTKNAPMNASNFREPKSEKDIKSMSLAELKDLYRQIKK